MSQDNQTYNILVACTGSVASVKLPYLLSELQTSAPAKKACNLRVVTTENALHFFDPKALPPSVEIFRDQDEWKSWTNMGDPVLHIELRKWADILIIAPLDANTLAKMACGLCDNLLTCIVRAWDKSRPLLFCPAMNTLMWEHPITTNQIDTLKQYGYSEVPPISKTLACGDTGIGAMANVTDIAQRAWYCLLT